MALQVTLRAVLPLCLAGCLSGFEWQQWESNRSGDDSGTDWSGNAPRPFPCPDEYFPAAPASLTGTTVGSRDDISGSCGGTGGADRSFDFTATSRGFYTFSTEGSNFDTVLYVLRDCGGFELACDDDTDGVQSLVSLEMRAGESVIVVVDGFNGASGDYVLSIVGN